MAQTGSPSQQQRAKLRCCASCEWIYPSYEDIETGDVDTSCPKCEFVSYGARFVHGQKAYRYAITQEPWLKKKLVKYELKLRREIPTPKPKVINILPLLA